MKSPNLYLAGLREAVVISSGVVKLQLSQDGWSLTSMGIHGGLSDVLVSVEDMGRLLYALGSAGEERSVATC